MVASFDDYNWMTNEVEMDEYSVDVKSFRKRTKKAVMLLMSLVSEDIATVLEQYEGDPKAMWDYLKEEYDKVTSEFRQLAKEKLNSFKVDEKLPFRDIEREFLSIL